MDIVGNIIKNIFAFIWNVAKVPLTIVAVLFVVWLIVYFMYFLEELFIHKKKMPIKNKQTTKRGLIERIFVMLPKRMVKDYFLYDKDAFSYQGLIIFEGRQGYGKTIAMTKYLIDLQNKFPLMKCITNYGYEKQNDELIHWKQLTDYNNDKYGVVVAMDETQNWFSSAESKKFPIEMLSVVTQNRKNKRLILGTAQSFYLLAKALRSQCTEVRSCRTFLKCLTVVTRKEPILDSDGNVKEWKRLGRYFFVHTDDVRNAYDTYRVIENLSKNGFDNNTEQEWFFYE